MSEVPPPIVPAARAAAERAVARCVGVATASAWVMLVLGGLSLAFSILAPLSAGFAISAAVCANGFLERRFARQLSRRDLRAPARLAWNQVALGLEIAAYGAWQAWTFSADTLDRALGRPLVAQVLAALDREVVRQMLEDLPDAIRTLYWAVGGIACLGCLATAWYYRSQSAAVRLLAANPPGESVSTPPRSLA